MNKKSATRKNSKKVVQSPLSAAALSTRAEPELSYDDMLSELEAIVSEADVRLAEEEISL